MPNGGNTVALKCPYPVTRHVAPIEFKTIEERFDFQIEKDGKLGRVSLGQFDLIKEVDSHKDEVGLINCLKMAEARGIDTSTFAKTEPGLLIDVPEIDTLDDLLKAKASADAKLKAIADTYGISVEQLTEVLKTGDFSSLKPKVEEKTPEGGAE